MANKQTEKAWIDINEQLPPIGKLVITKQKDYEKEDEFLMTYAGDDSELAFVTHWKEIL